MEIVDASALPKNQLARRGHALFRRFWGVRQTPSVLRIRNKRRKVDKRVYVSLGRSPCIHVSTGSQRRPGKQQRIAHAGRLLLVKPNGKGMVVWRQNSGPLPRHPKLRFIGYVPKTEYIATRDVERAGSHKRNTRWVHEHQDQGGTWPRLFVDEKGNYWYRGGTTRVGKWLYR